MPVGNDYVLFLNDTTDLIRPGITSATIKSYLSAASSYQTFRFGWGEYSLTDWASAQVITVPTVLRGTGSTILTGLNTVPMLQIRAPILFYGITFKNWGIACEINNNSGAKLDWVRFIDCEFIDCINPIYAQTTAVGVKHFYAAGCRYDGTNLTLHNGTPRTTDGNAFVDIGCPTDSADVVNCYARNAKRGGVWFGHEDQGQSGSLKKINVDGFVLETGAAGEPGSGSSNNFHGVIVRGAHDVVVTNCRISNLETADNDDCEGIYTKSVRTVVSNNTLIDAGHHDAAIVAKGNPRAGDGTGPNGYRNTIVNNQISFTSAYTDGKLQDTRGIRTLQDDILVAGNTIEGATGDAIVCGLHGLHTNNVGVHHNTILGHRQAAASDCGIRMSAGNYCSIESNKIFVTPQTGIAGRCIRLQPTDAVARKSWSVRNNVCQVTGGGTASRGILASINSDIDYLEISGNEFLGVQNGIHFESGVTLSLVRMANNRFAADVTTPINFADATNTPTKYWIENNVGRSPVGTTFPADDANPDVRRWDGGLFYATAYTINTNIGRFDGADNTNGKGIDDGTVIHIMMGPNEYFRIQHNTSIRTKTGADIQTGQANRIFSFVKMGGLTPIWLQIGAADGSAASA